MKCFIASLIAVAAWTVASPTIAGPMDACKNEKTTETKLKCVMAVLDGGTYITQQSVVRLQNVSNGGCQYTHGAVDDMRVNIAACGTFAKENWRIETPFKDPKAK
jgi:hypothetical protein